ncbi:MAG: hypothetical protein M3Z84_04485 [Actinomycetota bacterium]|nr:hypothetical protein [Actinomycetota bacterium]
MDLPPWVNSPSDTPADPDEELRRRLTAIESGLASIGERLDAFGTTIENSVREAVAKDVEVVAADLRHTVSDLGRLLVRDLGRLSKILSEHRDTIVAEVRGQPLPSKIEPRASSPSSPSPASGAPPLVDVEEPPIASIPVADGAEASGDDEPGAPAGGWRGNRRRRRDS